MAEPALHIPADALFQRSQVSAAGMSVAVHRETALAPKQLVHGHARAFAFDVPESLIQTAQGVIQNWPVSPVRARVSHLPQVLDIVRLSAATEGVKILFHRG